MPNDSSEIRAPMASAVISVAVAAGQRVRAGDLVAILEAMKMEHELRAERDALVVRVMVRAGQQVAADEVLAILDERVSAPAPAPVAAAAAPTTIRDDLRELQARLAATLDAARPDAIAKRHALGMRTIRENIADLLDDGSFTEYGALAIAAQRSRRSLEDLVANTPADGLVAGIGTVNGAHVAVLGYDATVLAGTQGARNHQKTDRLLAVALAQQLPVVLFAEGGGGRPGDTDYPVVAGLHLHTFAAFAKLSGRVPVVGVVAGRCFAGNAALLGCCDAIIATRASYLGMGGPAMIEGGGLGSFAPEQIGPAAQQAQNGVIDILVDDEARAVAAARRYLAFFAGRAVNRDAHDQAPLRDALPALRARAYDMRAILSRIADIDSLLELRAGFGGAVLTALARIDGRPVGILASNPSHLAGAIDPDAADKGARFIRLCDAHGLPIISFVDTPGFLVGPDVEARAHVRHAARLFVAAANLRVPWLAVVVRRGYGLGAMALTGGGFHAPMAICAWPSGEFGAMGIEGAVRLGYRKELAAAPDRDALFQQLVDRAYADGKALNMAATLELDAVIDPLETRDWLARGLAAGAIGPRVPGPIDSW